ncbi:MAG: uroporphyrinogen-III synthase [Gammaproteobacteria bacterium]|tara:strand:- start:9980 stop:10699 length:720 start_codon:yes stop_codon:yes gene_type:complete
MHILITRQLDQSKNFSSLLNELNIKNTIFPVIKIKKIKLNEEQIENIKNSDLIIFTSQNSVTSLIDNLKISDLDGKIIAAIGKSTSKLLEDIGIKVDICPESDFTSETLFKEIKKKNIKNKKVTIIKGIGGRNFLQDNLSQDNHVYSDINVYSRNLPDEKDCNIDNILEDITHICITSIDVFSNLKKILDLHKISNLKKIIFISGNEKIANVIKTNFPNNSILISSNPTNEEMLKVVLQ